MRGRCLFRSDCTHRRYSPRFAVRRQTKWGDRAAERVLALGSAPFKPGAAGAGTLRQVITRAAELPDFRAFRARARERENPITCERGESFFA